MDRHRVRTDNEEANTVAQERGEHVKPVFVHAGRMILTGICNLPYDGACCPENSHILAVSSHTIARRSAAVVSRLRSSPGSSPRRYTRTGQ